MISGCLVFLASSIHCENLIADDVLIVNPAVYSAESSINEPWVQTVGYVRRYGYGGGYRGYYGNYGYGYGPGYYRPYYGNYGYAPGYYGTYRYTYPTYNYGYSYPMYGGAYYYTPYGTGYYYPGTTLYW